MIEEAGKVYVKSGNFEPAARCYLEIKMWEEAGRFFLEAGKYIDAAFAYLDGNLYGTLIDLLQR